MNVVTRALTQNLRDIRTNWAGSGPWLLRVGTCILVMAATGLLGRWASTAVLGEHTDTLRLLLSQAVKAAFLGLGVTVAMSLFRDDCRPIRAFVATWILTSTVGFLLEADLPRRGWEPFLARVGAITCVFGVITLFRAPLRKFFGSESRHSDPTRMNSDDTRTP